MSISPGIKSLTLLLTILLLTGCSLFELREAEDPDDTVTGLCQPVYTPEDVIQNFRQSFTLLDADCYFGCFADSTWTQEYSFIPETGFQDFPLFSNWTAQSEYDYLTSLSQHFSGENALREHLLSLTNELLTETGDFATYDADYQLTMFLEDTLHSYAGGIQLMLSRQGTFQDWAIYSWEDQAVPDSDSWTVLKVMILQ
jgi:hypothetical protein